MHRPRWAAIPPGPFLGCNRSATRLGTTVVASPIMRSNYDGFPHRSTTRIIVRVALVSLPAHCSDDINDPLWIEVLDDIVAGTGHHRPRARLAGVDVELHHAGGAQHR